MKDKLQPGDYVHIKTESEADELLRLEGHLQYSGRTMSVCCGYITASSLGTSLHLNWNEHDKENLLTYEEFLQRSKNTFQ